MTPPQNIEDNFSSQEPKLRKKPGVKWQLFTKIHHRGIFYVFLVIITVMINREGTANLYRTLLLDSTLEGHVRSSFILYVLGAIGLLFFETEGYNTKRKATGFFLFILGVVLIGAFTVLWFLFGVLAYAPYFLEQAYPPLLIIIFLWLFPTILAIELYCVLMIYTMGEPNEQHKYIPDPNENLDEISSSILFSTDIVTFNKRMKIWMYYIFLSVVMSSFYSLTEIHQLFIALQIGRASLVVMFILFTLFASMQLMTYFWWNGSEHEIVKSKRLVVPILLILIFWGLVMPRFYLGYLERITDIASVHFLAVWTIPTIILMELYRWIFEELSQKIKQNREQST
ncbi:MAG: hypothetical protein GY810_18140 [Aureispira sp.]|nr:hypothetical protein [Aureispira sp.]